MHLSPAEQAFVQANLLTDPARLLLQTHREIDLKKVAVQIQARQKIRFKLPTWYAEPQLVFPVSVSVEQSSSEATAHYKASLVSGSLLIDGTGGMGVDSFYFSKRCERVQYVERNAELVEIARYNLAVLNSPNVSCAQGDSLDFLRRFDQRADWLYLDPARRAADSKRIVQLSDCEPDVTAHLPLFFEKADRVLVKASPLLDLKQALLELHNRVARIHVVAVENECKEVLFELVNYENRNPTVLAVNLLSTKQISFSFNFQSEQIAVVRLSDPLRYLYEPNAAVLKAGAFKSVGVQFGVSKLAPHSHLYTSTEWMPDFPGRAFEITEVCKADAKSMSLYLPDGKANLTVRNFPATTDQLRKQLRLKDGGEVYLFATTLANGDKRILVTKKAFLN